MVFASPTSLAWLSGGGEMGARMRAKDCILMTGNFEVEPSKEIAGMRILQKPCTEGELIEEIAKALS